MKTGLVAAGALVMGTGLKAVAEDPQELGTWCINMDKCTKCGICEEACEWNAIFHNDEMYMINWRQFMRDTQGFCGYYCHECTDCYDACPSQDEALYCLTFSSITL